MNSKWENSNRKVDQPSLLLTSSRYLCFTWIKNKIKKKRIITLGIQHFNWNARVHYCNDDLKNEIKITVYEAITLPTLL